MNLALLRGLSQEMYPEALLHLDEKYKIDEARHAKGGMGFAQVNRGAFLWKLGRYPEARAALDSAFEIANQPEANFKAVLAWVHVRNGQMALSQLRYDEAKKSFERAIRLDPKYADAHNNLGVIHYVKRNAPAHKRERRSVAELHCRANA